MWLMPTSAWLIGAVAVAGWVWGSFLNAVVDRTPRRGETAVRVRGGADSGEAVTPWHPRRSLCLACGAPVAARDNVPVLSWLWLRGRCRHCGAAVGVRTLLVELTVPALFGVCAGLWGTRPVALLVALAAVSWGVPAVVLLAERRRFGWRFLALGGVIVLAGVIAVLFCRSLQG